MKNLMKTDEFPQALERLAHRIHESKGDSQDIAFVGIHTRGVPLATRLTTYFQDHYHAVNNGMLNINLYRDDLTENKEGAVLKETKIDFDIEGKVIYLCDDVLYTGRTIRAAMEALFSLGRPKEVHLVVWARRTGRELPIDTELYALDVDTVDGDNVKVKFVETDDKDDVTLLQKGDY